MRPFSVLHLTQRADFLSAASSGHKFVKPSLIVQCRARNASGEPHCMQDDIRIGFTATRKLGGATVRNRIKRRMRAAAFQLLPELGVKGRDYVFIGRTGAYMGSFDDLIRDMKHALKRLADPMVTAPKP